MVPVSPWFGELIFPVAARFIFPATMARLDRTPPPVVIAIFCTSRVTKLPVVSPRPVALMLWSAVGVTVDASGSERPSKFETRVRSYDGGEVKPVQP